jgi:hypothetical protein
VCLCGACDVSHLTGWFSTSCPTLEVGLPLSWMWTVLACTRRTPYGCQLFAVTCKFYMLAVLLGDALSLSQALSAGCTPYGIVHACRACLPCTPGNIVLHSSPGACVHVSHPLLCASRRCALLQGREGKVTQVYRKKWVIHIERITREKVNGEHSSTGASGRPVVAPSCSTQRRSSYRGRTRGQSGQQDDVSH